MGLKLEEVEEFVALPEDSVITAKIEKVELETVNGRDGATWEKVAFKFKILSVDLVGDGGDPADYAMLPGSPIFGGVSARFTTHPDNKLRQWVEAILGMQLTPGFDLDLDSLVGRKVRCVTTQYTKKDATVASQKVASLLPLGTDIPRSDDDDLAPPF